MKKDAIWYWQDRLAKFFPTSKGPTNTEISMFNYGLEEGKKTVEVIKNNDLIYRLKKRAEIRRNIKTRKSVQENKPDRISDLLEEAANYIEKLTDELNKNEKE